LVEVEILRTFTKENLAAFFETYFINKSTKARIFSAWESQKPPTTKPDDHPENDVVLEPQTHITNFTAFKGSLPLFPLFQPSPKFFPLQGSSKLWRKKTKKKKNSKTKQKFSFSLFLSFYLFTAFGHTSSHANGRRNQK
jgi:hypothetical protein